MAAITANHEMRPDLYRASIRDTRDNSDDAPAVPDEVDDLVLHTQIEAWKRLRSVREEIQEVPLGHQGYELATSRHVPKVGDLK
jgi:hypothetical protein